MRRKSLVKDEGALIRVKSFRRLIVLIIKKIIDVVDLDIVKSMTYMCDGGAHIFFQCILIYKLITGNGHI